MKAKLLFSALLSFSFYFLSSQVPQGFNYQAIARNSNGLPITSQTIPVRISIVTSLTGGTVIWQEEHPSVTADQYGLISLVVGTGIQTGGSAASFSAIDWSAQTLFLKTEVKYPGPDWTNMGTSQIWAVPYSLVAKNIAPLSKLGITGTTTDMEEALFEVKNQAGNTVFAVYNEGIRAYVGNGDAKGKRGGFAVGGYDATKGTTIYDLLTLNTDSARLYFDTKPNLKGKRGGFAVGGYDMTKGSVQNFLDVSEDSVRIYIDSNPLTKGKRGGFAVGGYDMTKGTNDNYLNVSTDATGIVNPVNRILWYPNKNAFLAGNIRIGTPDSVGVNSFATGYRSKSRGMYSQAMGYKAIANGDYSTAIGKNAVANNINSFAFGENAQAKNGESYAIGRGAIANGYRSFAFGSAGVDSVGHTTGVAIANGDYSFALGQGSQSIGSGAFSYGLADTAKGNYSLSLGYKSSSVGYGSIAIGYQTTARGSFGAISLGDGTTASGNYSTAIGFRTVASGAYSIAMGNQSNASGTSSTAIGWTAIANANYSTAIGLSPKASGVYSTALGNSTLASGTSSTAMGQSTQANGMYSVAMGGSTKANADYSTAMGYLTKANGIWSTAMGFSTMAGGDNSTTLGNNTSAPSFCETAIGYGNTVYTPASTGGWSPMDRLFVIGYGFGAPRDAFTVLKNGNIGIGTSSPSVKLHVQGNTATDAVIFLQPSAWNSTSDYGELRFGDNSHYIRGQYNTGMTFYDYNNFYFANANVGIGTSTPGYKLTVNGTAWCSSGAWTGSDIRWKKNITEINDVLSNVLALKPVTYQWKTDEFPEMNFTNDVQIGLIAQDVEKLFPSLVMTDNNGYKAVSYEKLSVILLEGIKEQQKEIDELKTLVNTLIANQTAQMNK